MPAIKPKPDHPWRKGCIIRRDVTEHIKRSVTNPKVNNWKVGGALPAWNGRK